MRIHILGGGSVTAEYYLPALYRIGRDKEVTVVEASESSIASAARVAGKAQLVLRDYPSYLDGLTNEDRHSPQLVIICLPNRLHVDAVRRALDHGHHVLCEKPLALKASECAELGRLAVQKRVLLKVAMSRRYLPSLMLAREIVVGHELGAVRSIEIRDCNPFLWKPRSFAFFSRDAGGILADMGVHYLDFLETLIGPLSPISYSDDAKGGVESSAHYALSAGSTNIDMRLSRVERSGGYIQIDCEKGVIRINKGEENAIEVTVFGSGNKRTVCADQPFDKPDWPADFHGSFCQMLSDLEQAIEGRETRIADVTDAERTVALIEWAYAQRRVPQSSRLMQVLAPKKERKVLITGATGFIGGHLVDRLNDGQTKIRITARTPEHCANVARFPVEIVPINLLDKQSVQVAVDGCEIVYHLAFGKDGRRPEQTTIEGTKNVVEAAIQAGANCVVVLSTMYVFGFPKCPQRIDESFPYRPYGGEYAQSKALMERWCLERSRTSLPTRIVVLNPTCVFGTGGGAYTTLPVELARNNRFCWIDEGSGFCNYCYVSNLVDAIISASGVVAAHGNRFIINDGTVSWREFLEPFIRPFSANIRSYSATALRKLPRYGGPFRLADLAREVAAAPGVRNVAKRSTIIRAAFSMRRSMGRFRGGQGWDGNGQFKSKTLEAFPPEWLADLYSSARTTFSAEKAQKILHWQPKLSLAEAQVETVAWLVRSGYLPEPEMLGGTNH